MKILKINKDTKKKDNYQFIKRISFKIIFIVLTFKDTIMCYNLKKKKIGIIGLEHSQNIGNTLLKYSISIKLTTLGFDPYIIGKKFKNHNISLLQKLTKLKIINKNFQEIKENDYDILMVNSDQTWRKWNNDFYDIAFLNFAKDWNKPKIIYGASLGLDTWQFNKRDEEIAKSLLKNFTGISVREKGSIKFIENHLHLKPIFVLDPTFLIDKKYYLKIIKNFENDKFKDKNFIFIYTVSNSDFLNNYINYIKEKYNRKIFRININTDNQIKKFIYGIYNCKAVITDSFHGTVFSIIFNKPFISFAYKKKGIERFNTLKEVFNLQNRIFYSNLKPDIRLLDIPLNINKTILEFIKRQSNNFLIKRYF